MKYVDEFRDVELAQQLVDTIRRRATRRWTIMEVCGGQTHSLLRHGIDAALEDAVELIHGPGCPVCVTPVKAIDLAQTLAQRPGVTLASFGDMLRVPGTRGSLLDVRAAGGSVRAVYSPLDAVQLAAQEPNRQVVFFAVGFETTAPATALAVRQAAAMRLDNFSLLTAHVRVLPAMQHVMLAAENRVQGFLAAGHVCTVMGYECYRDFVQRHAVPVVVTGFEPIDLLQGIARCVECLEANSPTVSNAYGRSVRAAGNTAAQDVVQGVFEVCDRPWRGMGTLAGGGLRLKDGWREFDAESRFAESLASDKMSMQQARRTSAAGEAGLCRAGEVLSGQIKPLACAAFGRECTPERPLGAPMVSSEGACAAYFLYQAPSPDCGAAEFAERTNSK